MIAYLTQARAVIIFNLYEPRDVMGLHKRVIFRLFRFVINKWQCMYKLIDLVSIQHIYTDLKKNRNLILFTD